MTRRGRCRRCPTPVGIAYMSAKVKLPSLGRFVLTVVGTLRRREAVHRSPALVAGDDVAGDELRRHVAEGRRDRLALDDELPVQVHDLRQAGLRARARIQAEDVGGERELADRVVRQRDLPLQARIEQVVPGVHLVDLLGVIRDPDRTEGPWDARSCPIGVDPLVLRIVVPERVQPREVRDLVVIDRVRGSRAPRRGACTPGSR